MASRTLRFSSLPAGALPLVRAAITPRDVRAPWPELEAEVARARIDGDWLARYRAVSGFRPGSEIPVTVPQVLAVPLHIAMLADASFPLRAMGIVHVSQEAEWVRPSIVGREYALRATLSAPTAVKRGTQFSLQTTLVDGTATVWRGETVILSRQKRPGHDPVVGQRAPAGTELPEGIPSHAAAWSLPEDLGRRYTAVAGDLNPIHLSSWTARPFGFKRAIIHGMWTLARSVAEVEMADPGRPVQSVSIAFRRPIELPATVNFRAWREGQGTAYVVQDRDEGKAHARGRMTHAR